MGAEYVILVAFLSLATIAATGLGPGGRAKKDGYDIEWERTRDN